MGDGEQRTGSSIGRVLAVQAVAYVVLFGVTGVLEFTFGNQGGVAQGVAIALAVVLLVLFQVGWPFRAGIADRLMRRGCGRAVDSVRADVVGQPAVLPRVRGRASCG